MPAGDRDLKPATRAVRAGERPTEQGAPIGPQPVFAAPFHLRGDPASSPYGYGRYDTPTWTAYEAALGELERADALVFASGMAAATAILLPALRPGDAVVLPSDGYFQVRALAREHLTPRGIEVRQVPTDEEAVRAALPGAALLWLESPSNPKLDVVDLRALASAGHAEGALVAVDNTLATPLGQSPLDLGADVTMHSITKATAGHGDLLLGSAATRSPEQHERLARWRSLSGPIAGPFEAWLAHRSLATLDVRLQRMSANALALAEALSARDDVLEVRYPGLPADPAHAVAARQMRLFGPVVSFTLRDAEAAQRFLDGAGLVVEATSFGGVHTMAERRRRWGADGVPEGLVRLSAGIEDPDDLLRDVTRALDALG
ncbi:MAG TPA: cystathionine gamma-lyase [Solirubrobacteraceae bacterium]|nr:cystathionine gamma-lyase [Solirubrobacteraceae bacterium]